MSLKPRTKLKKSSKAFVISASYKLYLKIKPDKVTAFEIKAHIPNVLLMPVSEDVDCAIGSIMVNFWSTWK